jgi:hypothetical protein
MRAAPATLEFIDKVERAFLSSAKDNTTRVKCKIYWKTVCGLNKLFGLGFMNLKKFAMAVRIRWP